MGTEYKSQHYVQRKYLELFAKELEVYVFDKNRWFSHKPRDICSDDFFYSSENPKHFEEKWQAYESKHADSLKKGKKASNTSCLSTDDLSNLRSFAIFQYFRDREIRDQVEQTADYINNHPKYYLAENKNTISKRVQRNIMNRTKYWETVVSDLCTKIVENQTDVPLITSDAPVLILNEKFSHLLFGHRVPDSLKRKDFGLGHRGIQFIFPITPSRLVIIYDNESYKIPQNNPSISSSTAHILNCMQMMSCTDIVIGMKNNSWSKAGTAVEKMNSKLPINIPDSRLDSSMFSNYSFSYTREKQTDFGFRDKLNVPDELSYTLNS